MTETAATKLKEHENMGIVTRVIYKYVLGSSPDDYHIEMPEGAEVLSCGQQGHEIVIWARVDPNKFNENRYFRMWFTGEGTSAPDNEKFIGTVQSSLNSLVYHVFEVLE